MENNHPWWVGKSHWDIRLLKDNLLPNTLLPDWKKEAFGKMPKSDRIRLGYRGKWTADVSEPFDANATSIHRLREEWEPEEVRGWVSRLGGVDIATLVANTTPFYLLSEELQRIFDEVVPRHLLLVARPNADYRPHWSRMSISLVHPGARTVCRLAPDWKDREHLSYTAKGDQDDA